VNKWLIKKWLMHLEMTGEQNGWLFKWLLDEINILWNDLFINRWVYGHHERTGLLTDLLVKWLLYKMSGIWNDKFVRRQVRKTITLYNFWFVQWLVYKMIVLLDKVTNCWNDCAMNWLSDEFTCWIKIESIDPD